MTLARWLLLALLALPVAELVAFIVVAVLIGLAWALLLQAACSFAGLMVLRQAGGTQVARVRAAMQDGRIDVLSTQSSGAGALTLLSGILMLIPGFITDLVGVVLLLGTALRSPPQRTTDGIIDLEPEQWRRVDDPSLADKRKDADER